MHAIERALLDHPLVPDGVHVADELHLDAPAVVRPQRQILVADVPFLLERPERHLIRLDVVEQADLPQLLPDQLVAGVAEQGGQERVRVEHPSGHRVDQQDAVLGRLEQAAVADLGEGQGFGGPPPVGRVLDRQQDQPGPAAGRVEPAGVEDHRAAADPLERVIHLEVAEAAVPRQNLLEQLPQPGDGPLAVPEVEEGPALGVRRAHPAR